MRIAITGATGVIGASLAASLQARGHDLILTDANQDRSLLDLFGVDQPVFECDVANAEQVNEFFATHPADVCIHLAAIVSFPVIEADLVAALNVNTGGTLNILAAASTSVCGRVVLASSKAIYGYASGTHADPSFTPFNEADPFDPCDPYASMKTVAEVAGRLYSANSGLEFTALRFGTIVGPGKTKRHGNSSLYTRLVEQAVDTAVVEIPDTLDQTDDLVYVRDCAAALSFAAEAKALPHPAYNISSGRRTSIQQFIDAIRTRLPHIKVVDPDHGGIALPTRNYRCVLDISLAIRDLGYTPQFGIEEMVDDMILLLSRP